MGKAQGGVIRCGVCDSCFTLPKADAPQKVLGFLSQGEHELDIGKFEDAYSAFNKAAELDKTEPEAYWGMALAEFKIQYLKDEVNNRLQTICHDLNDKDFADSPYFLKALRYATEAQRAEYERKGEEINYIKNEFLKVAQTGLDYDCFICVKVTDENGGRTVDYKYADDIYFELKGKGYKPFFSERELIGVTGADYEARILYALKSSECMLVVCFDEAYLRTKWVKNEYSRFLKLVNDEEKESDSIALVFGDRPVEKLPGKKGKIQGIALNSLTAMERIVSFVDAHTPEARKRREEQARRKDRENEDLRNELEELKKMLLNSRSTQSYIAVSDSVAEKVVIAKPAPVVARTAVASANSPSEFEIVGGVLKKYKGSSLSVLIPVSVKEIGNYSFNNCRIETVHIHGKVRSVGNYAFNNCTDLKNLTLDDGLIEIDNYAFNNCSALVNLVIPDTVTEVSSYAFNNCGGLKKVVIGSGVKRIGAYAFNNCVSLREVTLPARFESSVKKIFGMDPTDNGGRCTFIFKD